MILIDTGYLLALAEPRDALHKRALMWADSVAESCLVSEYVLWELLNALSAKKDRSKGHLILSHIHKSPRFFEVTHASEEIFSAGIALHRQCADKDWSLTDCISFHLMRERGIRAALAFDQHFEQAGFEALLRKDPLPAH